jgi:hypothetical protein
MHELLLRSKDRSQVGRRRRVHLRDSPRSHRHCPIHRDKWAEGDARGPGSSSVQKRYGRLVVGIQGQVSRRGRRPRFEGHRLVSAKGLWVKRERC